MERPNTVAGLLAKRSELTALRAQLEAELRKVVCDLDHLDATIRLFTANAEPEPMPRYRSTQTARTGHVKRFVLEQLREAGGPLTSREVTEAWMADRGLAADERTYIILRKRIGACLIGLRGAGVVRNADGREGYVGYELADPVS